MTDEVDLRLVALGLAPAPTAAPPAAPSAPAPGQFAEQANPFAETATPPSPAADATDPGGVFAGMGKFTGMPADAAPSATPPGAAQRSAPPWTPPAAPPAPAPYMPPPAQTPPAYTPPKDQAPAVASPPPYVPPVAPRVPDAPLREAPPPLPPLAAAMPIGTKAVEAPALPVKKKEKSKKAKPEKAERVGKPEKVKPPPKPRFVLAPSGVLLRGPIVMGYPEKKLQITLEQLGFRIDAAPEPIDVAWSDVRDIKARRGRVVVRTKGRPVAFGIPVEGVAEPTLAGPLARVVKEASGGSLDLAGSAFLELQNATDSLRDQFHDEDDPLVPTVVGLVFGLAGLTFTALLPDALSIATRTPVAPGAFLLDYPLAGFDPRILAAGFAAAAMLAAGIVRVAMGRAATAWARGTLRGWHDGARRPVDLARRGLAAIVLSPAIGAAVLLGAFVTTLPSARVQTVIDESGFHIMTAFPLFDDNRAWSTVTDMTTISAPTVQHFEGVAVVFTFKDKGPLSTLDARVRGGTDKQLLVSAAKWREEHPAP